MCRSVLYLKSFSRKWRKRRFGGYIMEKNRKKSIQEKVSELQKHIKKLNEKCAPDSGKKAAIMNVDSVDHTSDVMCVVDSTCSRDDEMIVNINDLDLSNEETWLYIPEKSLKDEKSSESATNLANGKQNVSRES